MKNITLIFLSIFAVIIATLNPFILNFPSNFSLEFIIASFDNSSSFEDLVNNILLFMPLGFSLTAFLQRKNMKLISKLLIVILISSSLSTIVEILQMFIPPRTPTPADIINNTMGGICGMICFYIWHSPSFLYILSCVENRKSKNVIRQITLFFIGYIFISFLIAIFWQSTTNLSTWKLNNPLLLGNEKTGDRPWSGYISEVSIADRAFSQREISLLFDSNSYLNTVKDSLIADYDFTSKRKNISLIDQFPELVSQGKSSNIGDVKGVALNSNHWLKTVAPVTLLNERIRKSSQFTIFTTLATSNTNQTGPARIISISRSMLSRNFTLGQQGNDLDLRIRTSITGENGAHIISRITGFFKDTKYHQIVMTYSQAQLQVYIDTLQNHYYFNLLELIPIYQKIFYYALTFIPLGFYLMFLTVLANRRLIIYRLLMFFGILLPSLILEIVLLNYSGKSISLENILLSAFFIAATMLVLKLRASALVKKTNKN